MNTSNCATIPPPIDTIKPIVYLSDRHESTILRDAWRVLAQANKPPHLFIVDDGMIVRVSRAHDGRLSQSPVSADGLWCDLIDAAAWTTIDAKGNPKPAKLPLQYARAMLAKPDLSALPLLDRIAYTPYFNKGGKLVFASGYNPDSRILLDTDLKINMPDRITSDDEDWAFKLIDELICDFPFDDADDKQTNKAHAVGAMILPFVRQMIDGPTPLHMFMSSTAGTGKSLLAQIVSIVTTGQTAAVTTIESGRKSGDEEIRKKITSSLSSGKPILFWDNLQALYSNALAAALTDIQWTDRRLGKTEEVSFQNAALWLATSNNPSMSKDIARRICPIVLDANVERPAERSGFKHDPIRKWATTHRADLVRACLIMIETWLQMDRPAPSNIVGSYEDWSRVVGGILRVFYGDCFMLNQNEIQTTSSGIDDSMWGELFAAWYDKTGDKRLRPLDLLDDDDLRPLIVGIIGDKGSLTRKLAHALRKQSKRVIGGYKLQHEAMRGNTTGYYITSTSAPPQTRINL